MIVKIRGRWCCWVPFCWSHVLKSPPLGSVSGRVLTETWRSLNSYELGRSPCSIFHFQYSSHGGLTLHSKQFKCPISDKLNCFSCFCSNFISNCSFTWWIITKKLVTFECCNTLYYYIKWLIASTLIYSSALCSRFRAAISVMGETIS